MPANRLVDRFAMTAMQDVDRYLADIIERGAGFFQQRRDVLHRLVGLGAGIAISDEFAAKACTGLAAQVSAVAGAHRFAESAAQILTVLISFVSVKFPESPMRRALR